ncbi:MAG: YcbK family protein [Geminicoccaceae bacterium]
MNGGQPLFAIAGSPLLELARPPSAQAAPQALPYVHRRNVVDGTRLSGERRLNLFNPRSGERFHSAYWVDGRYLDDSIGAITWLMRDLHTGTQHGIDPSLLDLLHRVHRALQTSEPIHVLSGYRSRQTNDRLVRQGLAVPNSFHLKGQAMDWHIPGRHLRELRDCALALRAGGVGYYPKRHFLHVDTGPVRRWQDVT